MRTVVGVLRGGPSSEYDVSLKTGATVLRELDTNIYEPRDLFVGRDGTWHLHGVPVAPERALHGVDVVFNAIHGEFGEDGSLHRILDLLAVPYTGPGALASAQAFDKQRTKEIVAAHGIRVAHGVVVEVPADASKVERLATKLFRTFPHPAIVKPVIGGSSVGASVVEHYHMLAPALLRAAAISPRVLLEELVRGKEATVGVIEQFRSKELYALMPVEIIPPPNRFFDAEVKYNGQTIERVPGSFTPKEKAELERAALVAHKALGASHYSRSDFIVSARGVYFLELNSAQAVGMTEESLFPKALHAVGAKLSDFLHHVLQLAHKK